MDLFEKHRLASLSVFENALKERGFSHIAGVDEAGRGPLAGPVVAAACILLGEVCLERLNDSKQLSVSLRASLFEKIKHSPQILYGIGIVEADVIDKINILQATFLAMQKAVDALPIKADYLLIDGNRSPTFEVPSEALVKGDSRSASIAAASVLAKVTRDHIMEEWDVKFPHYGFKKHKGYGTKQHISALMKYGPAPIHRKSFDPVSRFYTSQVEEELNFC